MILTTNIETLGGSCGKEKQLIWWSQGKISYQARNDMCSSSVHSSVVYINAMLKKFRIYLKITYSYTRQLS